MSAKAAQEISALFQEQYARKPDVVSVAPGRVNLIGEHVDHQGYSVLPTALGFTIQFAIAKVPFNGNLFELHHPNRRFPSRTIKDLASMILSEPPLWSDYLLAALYGVCEFEASDHDLSAVGSAVTHVRGMINNSFAQKKLTNDSYLVMVAGNVPVAAGVSSSSAVVVAAASGFMQLFGLKYTRIELADICANAERHVGTAGGGMDQASICLSKPGGAQLISFKPLQAETVFLPKKAALVVTNTCREVPKAETAATFYNKRVFELKLACFMILKGRFPEMSIPAHMLPTLTLKFVQEKCEVPLEEACSLVEKHIPNRALSRQAVLDIVGEDGVEALSASRVGPEVWKLNTFFDPYRRAFHVYSEAFRVHKFARICRDANIGHEEKLVELGRLMELSDESLTVDFDCSCPELCEVNRLAKLFGAYGSRLTGAGWGGCAVSLVNEDKLERFMEQMKVYFNQATHPNCKFPEDLSAVLFPVIPGPGATLYDGENRVIEWN